MCTVIFIHAGEDHKNPTVCWQWTKHEEQTPFFAGGEKRTTHARNEKNKGE